MVRRAAVRPPVTALVVSDDLSDVPEWGENLGNGRGVDAGTTVHADHHWKLDPPFLLEQDAWAEHVVPKGYIADDGPHPEIESFQGREGCRGPSEGIPPRPLRASAALPALLVPRGESPQSDVPARSEGELGSTAQSTLAGWTGWRRSEFWRSYSASRIGIVD